LRSSRLRSRYATFFSSRSGAPSYSSDWASTWRVRGRKGGVRDRLGDCQIIITQQRGTATRHSRAHGTSLTVRMDPCLPSHLPIQGLATRRARDNVVGNHFVLGGCT
jgi:hypothetical protein